MSQVTEIKAEARLAILRGLASQVKFSPANADTFDFQPLLLLAERLGFREEPRRPQQPTMPTARASATPEDDYRRYPNRE